MTERTVGNKQITICLQTNTRVTWLKLLGSKLFCEYSCCMCKKTWAYYEKCSIIFWNKPSTSTPTSDCRSLLQLCKYKTQTSNKFTLTEKSSATRHCHTDTCSTFVLVNEKSTTGLSIWQLARHGYCKTCKQKQHQPLWRSNDSLQKTLITDTVNELHKQLSKSSSVHGSAKLLNCQHSCQWLHQPQVMTNNRYSVMFQWETGCCVVNYHISQ